MRELPANSTSLGATQIILCAHPHCSRNSAYFATASSNPSFIKFLREAVRRRTDSIVYRSSPRMILLHGHEYVLQPDCGPERGAPRGAERRHLWRGDDSAPAGTSCAREGADSQRRRFA